MAVREGPEAEHSLEWGLVGEDEVSTYMVIRLVAHDI